MSDPYSTSATELTEAEQQKLNTGRLLRAESDMILPLLQTKERLVIGKIVSTFRDSAAHSHASKAESLLAHAAELSTIAEMKIEIMQKIKTAEAIERKLYEDPKR